MRIDPAFDFHAAEAVAGQRPPQPPHAVDRLPTCPALDGRLATCPTASGVSTRLMSRSVSVLGGRLQGVENLDDAVLTGHLGRVLAEDWAAAAASPCSNRRPAGAWPEASAGGASPAAPADRPGAIASNRSGTRAAFPRRAATPPRGPSTPGSTIERSRTRIPFPSTNWAERTLTFRPFGCNAAPAAPRPGGGSPRPSGDRGRRRPRRRRRPPASRST